MPCPTFPLRRLIASASAVILTCVTFAFAGGDLRTWSDATGKFKIEAKFVSQEKGTVTLEGKDGKQFQIEATKLSAADQKILADLAKKKTTPEDPFKQVPVTPKGPSAKSIATDWKSARLVDMVPASTEWKMSAKPGVPAKVTSRPIGLPSKVGFFDAAKALVTSAAGERAAVGFHVKAGKDTNTTVVACDLVKSKMTGMIAVPGLMIPVAVNDEGTQVILRADAGFGKPAERLEIWTISEKGGVKLLEFTPYESEKGNDRNVHSVDYLPGNRLMTNNHHGRLVIWDMSAGKALYHMAFQGGAMPALSPDRTMLAFTTGKEVGILDLEAGKVLAMEPSPNHTPWATLTWSPNGKLIALFAFERVFVLNVADGSTYREIVTSPFQMGGSIQWTNDKNLLFSGRHLVDIEAQIRFWEYTGHAQAQMAGGLGWFVIFDKQSGLIPSPLPHPVAQQTLAKALNDPNFIVLKTGTSVKIDVSGLPDVAERAKVSSALQAQLEKIGCKVSPTGTINLVASTDVGKQRELAFRSVSAVESKFPGKFASKKPPTGPVQNASIEEHFARLKFVYQGTAVWEQSAHNVPSSLRLREGETLEQHLKTLERPNYAFYQSVQLPRLLLRAKGTAALGTSQVSVAGIR